MCLSYLLGLLLSDIYRQKLCWFNEFDFFSIVDIESTLTCILIAPQIQSQRLKSILKNILSKSVQNLKKEQIYTKRLAAGVVAAHTQLD